MTICEKTGDMSIMEGRSVAESGIVIERWLVGSQAGAAGEFISPGSTSQADFYFRVRSTPAVALESSQSFCQN